MTTGPVTVEFDKRALARFQKRVERYRGQPLANRMAVGTLEAAKLLVSPIKREAPVSQDKDPGGLRNKVRARKDRGRSAVVAGLFNISTLYGASKGDAKVLGANVTSTARHRHLVIRPHRIVTPGGRDTGRRTTGNPFIDRAAEPRADEAMRIVSRAIFGGA